MPFRQTSSHVRGKHSYHQVGAFTGQLMGPFKGDLKALLRFMGEELNLDSVEPSTWDLDLRRADTDEGARDYAKELVETCSGFGLAIVSLATHLQGQCLGDRGSLKTIQFQGGTPVMAAYEKWLEGNDPPDDNPYFIPADIAKMSQERAELDLIAAVRLAQYIGELNGRSVPVSGFIGSAGAWDDIFDFPPVPKACGKKITIGNRAEYAAKVIIRRFTRVWEECKKRGVKFGIESHPGELCAGDIESTKRFLEMTDAAGFGDVVGLNFDASHLVWQDVDPIEFIVTFIERIWSMHHKGVQVRKRRRSRAGVFGGWVGFGLWTRFWDFVYASSDRDSTNPEEIIATLNRLGWDGALTIECEDNDFDLRDCLRRGAKLVRDIDLSPAGGAFDEAFVKTAA